jgi:hypothetical protein
MGSSMVLSSMHPCTCAEVMTETKLGKAGPAPFRYQTMALHSISMVNSLYKKGRGRMNIGEERFLKQVVSESQEFLIIGE